jgi:hypothetical protein
MISRGKLLVSASLDSTAKLWDVSKQKAISTYKCVGLGSTGLNDCVLLSETEQKLTKVESKVSRCFDRTIFLNRLLMLSLFVSFVGD